MKKKVKVLIIMAILAMASIATTITCYASQGIGSGRG